MNTADATPVVYHLQHSRVRPQLTRVSSMWCEFSALLVAGHIERDDKDGPGFVLAEMSKPYRAAANVARFDAVLLDMDSHGDTQPPPPDIAAEMLAASGLAGVVYTTHSHTDAAPRYRVVVPLAEPVLPADLQRVTRAAADVIGLTGEALDPKSWVVGQFFYLPSCRPDAPRFAARLDGAAFEPPAVEPEPLALPVVDAAPAPAVRPAVTYHHGAGASLYDTAKARARGQWRGVLSSLGISVPDRERTHAPCPGCGGKDRFRFDDKDGDGSFICSQGGAGTLAGDGFDLVQHARRVDAAEALRLVCDSLGIQRRTTAVPVPAARTAAVDADTGEITKGPDCEPEPKRQPQAAERAPLDIFAEFPAPPIEPNMLPAAVSAYAFESSALVGVEAGMIAIPALVACAAALHDGVKIQPKRHETGWTESARLWCAVVGPPSVKKSASISRATRRMRKIDRDMAEDNARKSADHAAQMEAYKEAKKAAKKSGDPVPCPERPQLERTIVEDITVEALSEVLKDNARGVLCVQDELSGWFGSMDAYTGGKAGNKDRAAWLQAYNGGFRQVDRVMRGSVPVPNFSVSIIGGIQPDAIRRIAKDMTDDGLMQRFMILIGRNAKEYDRVEDGAVVHAFADLIDHLHGVQPGSVPVRLTEPAHQVRERLCDYAAELADYPALPGGLRSHLGKWSGLFARLLLTYHAIECAEARVHPASEPVRADTAERVERLMRRFLLPHAMAYYTDILGASTDLDHARWVAGYILSRGLEVVSNRDLVQAYKQWRGLDDWRRARVMQVLEDMSWVAPVAEDGRQARRGATSWGVNSQVHDLFASRAEDEASRRARVRAEVQAMQNRR